MRIQEWLSQLLARPATDPLDWESYCVTMDDATWKALWRDIDATQAFEDGLEAGFRLLQATQQHRVQLGPRRYQANQVLLYRTILERTLWSNGRINSEEITTSIPEGASQQGPQNRGA